MHRSCIIHSSDACSVTRVSVRSQEEAALVNLHMLRLVRPTREGYDVHELPDSADGQRDAAVCEGRHVVAHPLQESGASVRVQRRQVCSVSTTDSMLATTYIWLLG